MLDNFTLERDRMALTRQDLTAIDWTQEHTKIKECINQQESAVALESTKNNKRWVAFRVRSKCCLYFLSVCTKGYTV